MDSKDRDPVVCLQNWEPQLPFEEEFEMQSGLLGPHAEERLVKADSAQWAAILRVQAEYKNTDDAFLIRFARAQSDWPFPVPLSETKRYGLQDAKFDIDGRPRYFYAFLPEEVLLGVSVCNSWILMHV